MSMLSRWTIGRDGVEEGERSSPVSCADGLASAGEVSGPVATMTLSHSAGGRPATSLALDGDQRMRLEPLGHRGGEAVAVDGQRAAGRQLVRVAGAP